MLDTNILVNFVLVAWKLDKKQPIPQHLKKSEDLLARYELNQFENVMSDWNTFELRDEIFKLRLNQKLVESGYSSTEFSMARRDISLTQEEKDGVNEIVKDLWTYAIKETKDIDMRLIKPWTKKGFTFMDLILIYQACLNECQYFVTRDEALIKARNNLKPEFPIKIISIDEFVSKLP